MAHWSIITRRRVVRLKIEENDSFRFIENRKDCYYINAHCKTLSVDTPKDRIQVERYMIENGLA